MDHKEKHIWLTHLGHSLLVLGCQGALLAVRDTICDVENDVSHAALCIILFCSILIVAVVVPSLRLYRPFLLFPPSHALTSYPETRSWCPQQLPVFDSAAPCWFLASCLCVYSVCVSVIMLLATMLVESFVAIKHFDCCFFFFFCHTTTKPFFKCIRQLRDV